MPRVDVWDLPDPNEPEEVIWCGYARNLEDHYEFGALLGEGGFGMVRVVRHRSSGVEYACKSIAKILAVPNLPPAKKQQHIQAIQREIAILRKLRGTLNVVALEEVFEDKSHVHIMMEYCRGGELIHRIGKRHYSEKTVASYMRAVLRTLAQCHAQRILHRDIKPGNFMLLTEADDSPLKAIDFGLAVFFDPKQLPRTDLGLEGTPWFMAPEVLSSSVEPASDLWSAGVMAYQLLSGRFPFDDWSNPQAPALSMVWRSILTEQPNFKKPVWADISEPAKDFCRVLLQKDPTARPTAKEALSHPWLRGGRARQRLEGKQLGSVVQHLQRYNQQNVFKRTVLDMIANELIRRHLGAEDSAAGASLHGASLHGGSMHGGSLHGALSGSLLGGSLHGGLAGSLLGGALVGSVGDASRRDRESMEGSVHSMHGRRVGGSVRSGMSAMDALRRARERRSYAEALSQLGAKEPSQQGPAAAAAAPAQPYGTSPATSTGRMGRLQLPNAASPEQSSYKGPVKDPGAVAWDFNYMAHMFSMEGSAHGNPQAARLLRAGSPGLPTVPSARLEGTWHGPRTNKEASQGAAANRDDRSWHGPDDKAARASVEFQHFLEQARRHRLEQRKVARLVLETSTHGGNGYVSAEELQERQHAQQQSITGRAAAPASGQQQGAKKSGLLKQLKGNVLTGMKRALGSWSSSDASSNPASMSSSSGTDAALAAAQAAPLPQDVQSQNPLASTGPALARSSPAPSPAAAAPGAAGAAGGNGVPALPLLQQLANAKESPGLVPSGQGAGDAGYESGKRGQGAYAALMALSGKDAQAALPSPSTAGATSLAPPGQQQQQQEPQQQQQEPQRQQQEPQQQQQEPQQQQQEPQRQQQEPQQQQQQQQEPQQQQQEPQQQPRMPLRPLTAPKHVGFAEPEPAAQPEEAATSTAPASEPTPKAPLRPLTAPKHVGFIEEEPAAAPPTAAIPIPGSQQPPGTATAPRASPFAAAGSSASSLPAALKDILGQLQLFKKKEVVTAEEVAEQLAANGYRLLPGEVGELMRVLGSQDGKLERSQFVASQMEWDKFQVNHRDEWLDCLRTTFEGLDTNKDGRISIRDMMQALASKLPQEEVNAAIEDVLLEAAAEEDAGLDFEAFTSLVELPSQDSWASLDQFDARLEHSDAGTPDGSMHAGQGLRSSAQPLEVLSE